MTAALIVIPLAAMVIPIALILLAVLVDFIFLGWTLYRLWHDDWAVRIGVFTGEHLVRPWRKLIHHPVPGAR